MILKGPERYGILVLIHKIIQHYDNSMKHSFANKELIVTHNPLVFDDNMAAGTSMPTKKNASIIQYSMYN